MKHLRLYSVHEGVFMRKSSDAKSFFLLVSLFLSITGYAQGFPPNGDWKPMPPRPDYTPPCYVSDNCNVTPNYIPVWMQDRSGSISECPSPLYVRKDQYTCDKILRLFGQNQETVSINNNVWNQFQSLCPSCNIGFVGINAIIPEEQLHVIGNIKCQEGRFMGDIATANIYGEVDTDPDGVPYSGDETFKTIEVHQPMNYQNGFTSSIPIANLEIQNLTSTHLVTNNLTVTNQPTFLNGLKIKNSALQITDANNNVVWNFRADGKLGIGVPSSEMTGPYWLWVKNGIMTERLKVAVKNTADWKDYVFDKNYRLRTLDEVERYIQANKHLPEIPSAEEVVREGIDVQTMDAKLLQKIEELTLYVIELRKEINQLKKKK